MSTIIKTDELTQFHEHGIYTPARLIELSGEIDDDNANEFIRNIRILDYMSDEDIKILVNTIGGEVHSGLAIYDAIKECDSKVVAHVVGACWSIGAVILQAADERIMSPNATLMIHIGTDGHSEDHAMTIERWIEEHKKIEDISQDILLDRIKEKQPKFTRSKLQKLLMFDTIYRVDEAIEMGLADSEVVHKGF